MPGEARQNTLRLMLFFIKILKKSYHFVGNVIKYIIMMYIRMSTYCINLFTYIVATNVCLYSLLKGTNGNQKTYEIFLVYCIFYSGFLCQTIIFGITKDGSLE